MMKTAKTSLILAAVTATSAGAQPQTTVRGRPAEADLRFYHACSDLATRRVLTFEEAGACSRALQRIKLAFVSGVGFEEFEALSARERAAVNLLGYRRYLDWSRTHPDGEIQPAPAVASD